MSRKIRLPSPAMAVALAALFVALSGTAVAAVVPALAKRALVADNAKNAKKLNGKSSAQLLATAKQSADAAAAAAAQQPGPASTAVGIVSIKTVSAPALPSGGGATYSVSCDAGQKILSGGYSSPTENLAFQVVQSNPTSDTTWAIGLANISDSPAPVSLYAVCIK